MDMPILIVTCAMGAVLAVMTLQLKEIRKLHPNTKLLLDALERLAMHSGGAREQRK